jgi:hypothetical protein
MDERRCYSYNALMRSTALVHLGTGAAVVALASTIAVGAQQGAGGGGGAAPAPRPMVPMTASTIVLDPDTHVGENVSMMCTVEAILSKTVFTVDQDKVKSTGKDVLVIAPNLQMPVVQNVYVTVQGEVFKFDPAEVAKRARNGYVLDLPADVAAKYQGKPAVFATGVITAQLVDIGKRQPPPLTPAEQTLRAAMLAINANAAPLRGTDTDVAKAKEQIAALKKAFTDAETFFKSQNAADAIGWAGDALKFVGTMETATAGATPKWDDVRTAATGVGGLCAPCHGARRERQDDGSFRFKG